VGCSRVIPTSYFHEIRKIISLLKFEYCAWGDLKGYLPAPSWGFVTSSACSIHVRTLKSGHRLMKRVWVLNIGLWQHDPHVSQGGDDFETFPKGSKRVHVHNGFRVL
jgi:hypothetical protein